MSEWINLPWGGVGGRRAGWESESVKTQATFSEKVIFELHFKRKVGPFKKSKSLSAEKKNVAILGKGNYLKSPNVWKGVTGERNQAGGVEECVNVCDNRQEPHQGGASNI